MRRCGVFSMFDDTFYISFIYVFYIVLYCVRSRGWMTGMIYCILSQFGMMRTYVLCGHGVYMLYYICIHVYCLIYIYTLSVFTMLQRRLD